MLHLASLADSMTGRGFYSVLSGHNKQEISRPQIQREISKEHSPKEERVIKELSLPSPQRIPYEAAMGSTGDFVLRTCNIKDMEDFRQRVMKDCEGIIQRKGKENI